jgi:hypothetical protein
VLGKDAFQAGSEVPVVDLVEALQVAAADSQIGSGQNKQGFTTVLLVTRRLLTAGNKRGWTENADKQVRCCLLRALLQCC